MRYATSGQRTRANAQPMIVRHGRGTMALCHNGNLTNAVELRRQLEKTAAPNVSEVLYPVKAAIKPVVKDWIRLCGANGRY